MGEFLKAAPEAILTGFLVGLAVGAMQQAISKHFRPLTPDTAKEIVDKFLKDNNLPPPSNTTIDWANKSIQLHWNSPDPNLIINGRPLYSFLINWYDPAHVTLEQFDLWLRPSNPMFLLKWKYTYDAWWDFEHGFSWSTFEQAGIPRSMQMSIEL